MANDLELSKEFLNYILDDKRLSLQGLAEKLGCTKGYLGQVKLGKSPLSQKYFEKIMEVYPEYRNEDIGKMVVFKNNTGRSKTIRLTMYNSCYLTDSFSSRKASGYVYLDIDKRIIENNYTFSDSRSLEVVQIANNLLEPMFSHNDKVVLDTAVKTLSNGFIYVFYLNNDLYIREVIKNGNSIILANPNDKNDNFTISSQEEISIVGLIVPKVRF